MDLEQKTYDELVERQQQILDILKSEEVRFQEQTDELKKENDKIQNLIMEFQSKKKDLYKKKADIDQKTKELSEEYNTVDTELTTRRRRMSSEAEERRKQIQKLESLDDGEGLKEPGDQVVENSMLNIIIM